MLFLLLAASMAQASVVVEPGAPADYSRLRWADEILHSNPVLERGIAPSQVRVGYSLYPLSDRDRDGNPVQYYVTWTQGRSGEVVWLKVRPGESVESKSIGSREVHLAGRLWRVHTMRGVRFTRCGNPTSITWYLWTPIEVVTREVERPVEKPYPVYRTETRLVYTAQPVPIPTPHSSTYIVEHPGIIGGLLGVGAAYAGRTRISITATGGSAAASAAAASSSTATNTVDVDNTNVNINQNALQQQQ
jgi:hypothetical protein